MGMTNQSDNLAKQSERSKGFEAQVGARPAEPLEQLQVAIVEARARAAAAGAAVDARTSQAEDAVAFHWQELRRSLDGLVAQLKANVVELRADRGRDRAQRAAQQAEAVAANSLQFAEYAFAEAIVAVLEAAEARQHADALTRAA
jgi:hypothetical protein